MNILRPSKLPVFIAGMWQATKDDPESGARVLVQERVGEPGLLSGFSDELGEFRGHLPVEMTGKKVRIVIVEPSFLYDSYDSVKVERWGLFLPIRAKKDIVYNGSTGAKSIDYNRWSNWKETEEFSAASEKTHSAARLARIAWPLGYVGVLVAAIVGFFTLSVNPIAAIFVSVLVALGFNWLSKWLLMRGY